MAQLQLRDNNPYANGRIVSISGSFDLLERKVLEYTGSASDSHHTVKQGDLLTTIAYKKYKTVVSDPAKYWWIIADVNHIDNPLDIDHLIGTDILIPDLVIIKLRE